MQGPPAGWFVCPGGEAAPSCGTPSLWSRNRAGPRGEPEAGLRLQQGPRPDPDSGRRGTQPPMAPSPMMTLSPPPGRRLAGRGISHRTHVCGDRLRAEFTCSQHRGTQTHRGRKTGGGVQGVGTDMRPPQRPPPPALPGSCRRAEEAEGGAKEKHLSRKRGPWVGPHALSREGGTAGHQAPIPTCPPHPPAGRADARRRAPHP